MKWLKAAVVGALGSAAMTVVMLLYIRSGLAPFNVPPSSAFLLKLGVGGRPLSLLMHFGYGAFWSVVLVAVCGRRTNVARGLALAAVLLIIYLAAYAPVIGWAFLGFGGPGHGLPPSDPLYLGGPLNHLFISTAMHVVYGLTVGWLDSAWIDFGG